jgi:hypothetical protein
LGIGARLYAHVGEIILGSMDVKMPLLLRDTENNGSFTEFTKVFSREKQNASGQAKMKV